MARSRERGGGAASVPRIVREEAGPLGPVEAGKSVELAVAEELAGLDLAVVRPGLAATALKLGRLLDTERAVSQQPAAARVLADVLDRLHKGAGVKRSKLASVREMAPRERASG